jgi:hypothetical protein
LLIDGVAPVAEEVERVADARGPQFLGEKERVAGVDGLSLFDNCAARNTNPLYPAFAG